MIKNIFVFLLLLLSNVYAEVTAPTIIPGTDELRKEFVNKIDLSNASELDQKTYALIKMIQVYDIPESERDAVLKEYGTIKSQIKMIKDDPEIQAAFGALTSYLSSFFNDNYSKILLYSRKGMRLMDSAVKQNPEHMGARMQRGIAQASMPKFLNRADKAVEDLTMVLNHTKDIQDKSFIAMIQFYLAMAYVKNEDEDKAGKIYQSLSSSDMKPWSEKSKSALSEL
ncbi:hypothetical protein [Pleionea sediminis]|uniref:hypothetical protein n=1 Tax=Pleionea sediminis TaxID=2569479 RepID=UPI0011860909|nr:hypothetical protein [Pleionea sediminis]